MTSDTQARRLLEKIENKDAVAGIIGLGYVGLPLALALTEKGFKVLGFDVDPAKIDQLTAGECYIKHLDCQRVERAVGTGLFEATTEFARLAEPDAILICVPTPLGPHKEPDMRYVETSTWAVRETLRPGQLVILESTTYPGTTDELLKPILESSPATDVGEEELKTQNSKLKTLKCGTDFFLAFSPEREDPGNPSYGATNTPKVVGGVDQVSGDLAQAFYDQIVDSTVRTSSARVAEAAKLTENVFRSVNIALVNELKVIYDRLGLDIWDVLDAAETKPFGFMRFNPGPGLGGHCILGSEWLRIRGCGLSGVYRAADLFSTVARRSKAIVSRNGIFVEPDGLEALAVDAESGEVAWFPVSTLYRGRFDGCGRQVTTIDSRRLIVTDEHPMLVVGKGKMEVRPARELEPGDELPLVSDLGDHCANPVIDLLDVVPDVGRHRVWVRLKRGAWSDHESKLKAHFGWTIRDSIRKNSLRLDRFLEIENEVGAERCDLVLMTGRGVARRDWPSRLEVTPEFSRFIGYYLAEGCITIDRSSARVRLTFNRDEREYVRDVREILGSMGFPTSTYDDATWHSTTIKASSLLLAWLLDDAWKCGRRSEQMRIPDLFFTLSPDHKWQLLSGLLRGDGDVWTRSGKRRYTRNDRDYDHHDTTAEIGFFSCSEVLTEQVVHLLQDLGFQPGYKKRKRHIRLAGARTVEKLIPFFAGAKRQRLEHAQAHRRRLVKSRSDLPPIAPGLRSIAVKTVDEAIIEGWVYSMEVDGAGAFTTSSGIGVHNCIPLDPFYLAWRAREAGVPTRFIELAGEINHSMPGYVIEKLQTALNEHGKAVKGSKVLILGLAYKPNIDDPRESPAFEIIDRLLRLGAEVFYHDPHIPVAPKMRSWPDLPAMQSVDLSSECLASADATILVTDHKMVDYDFVLEHAPLIVDTRGVYRARDAGVRKA
jgi:UDP-N-acetyl-D-mannosaminuronate dehydrogenase/intein/homing endonuclease